MKYLQKFITCYIAKTLGYFNINAHKMIYFSNKKILTDLFLLIGFGIVLNFGKCINFERIRLYRIVVSLFILILYCKKDFIYGR